MVVVRVDMILIILSCFLVPSSPASVQHELARQITPVYASWFIALAASVQHALEIANEAIRALNCEVADPADKVERPELLLKRNESNLQSTAHLKERNHFMEEQSIPLMPDPEELLKAQKILDLFIRQIVRTSEQGIKQQEPHHLQIDKNGTKLEPA